MSTERPSVAVIVLVLKDGKVLLGRRSGNDGTAGMYGAPGGSIEYGESIPEAGIREVREETGLDVRDPDFVGVSSYRRTAMRHFVVIVMKADWQGGEPTICELDKCESWDWFPLEALPGPMTPGSANGIEMLKTGTSLIE